MNEKNLRIKYIRILEKFFTKTLCLLKLENFHKDLFIKRTKKNLEDINRFKIVALHSTYLVQLKEFVNKTIYYLENSSETFENERLTLLKDANLLQKEKRRKIYKKDKHKNSKFNDGY